MCSNPFQQGCLRQYLGEDIFSKKRVCNSQDKDGSSKEGLCDDAIFDDYQEIRILGQNWDSPMMSGKIKIKIKTILYSFLLFFLIFYVFVKYAM